MGTGWKVAVRDAVVAVLMSVMASVAYAQAAWDTERPDALLSVDLLGHPELRPRAVLLGYTYDREHFRDYRVAFLGTVLEPVSAEELLAYYPNVPRRMDRTIHHLTGAWAPRDGFVLDAQVPILSSSMDVLTDGPGFVLASSGIGDPRINASLRVLQWRRQRLDLHAGVSLPLGNLDPQSAAIDSLPYAMRNGIGTAAWLPGVSYLGQSAAMTWGLQVSFTVPTGTNERSYRMGMAWQGQAWMGGNWNSWLSSGARIAWLDWNEPTGADPALDTLASPLNDPLLLGGRQLDLWLNSSVRFTGGGLRGHRLFAEFGFPLYLEVNTLRSRWGLRVGAAAILGG